MSPSVGNFVHDLVEMAKAMETLPQVQEELTAAKHDLDVAKDAVANREARILDYKNQIEELQSKVRDAEVARDDAELRFLELDEKAGKVLNFLAGIKGHAEAAQELISPPKPEPQPVPEPIKSEPERTYFDPSMEALPQGQSESNPTSNDASKSTDTQMNVSGSGVASTEPASNEPAKPYSGKFYHDHPVYVSLHDWIEGGGTEENYYRSKPRDQGGW